MAHLLLLGLGPVQEFIAAARRSRDLWFGSWLLSDLSKAAAAAIPVTDPQAQLIFPDPSAVAGGSMASVANKVFARVERDPGAVAVEARDAMRARLHKLRAEAFDAVAQAIHDRLNNPHEEAYGAIRGTWRIPDAAGMIDLRAAAEAQVDDLPEFYWVAVPVAADDRDYAAARHRAEALFAARKTTRDFGPTTAWARAVPKSSLDGARESVIPEGYFPRQGDNDSERKARTTALYHDFGAGPAERLSGVDLLKRLGAGRQAFASTSDLAARPFLARLSTLAPHDKNDLHLLWQKYIEALPERITQPEKRPANQPVHAVLGEYFGSLLYESRLEEDEIPADALDKARQALDGFYTAVDSLLPDHPRPDPYYALLAADGDHMGGTIDALTTLPAHQQFSRELARFAAGVRTIVETDHGGELVYAGGDDVLAFVPLHQVVDCANALHDAFAGAMARALAAPSSPAPGGAVAPPPPAARPTLSVGVVIMHHLDPLREALECARDAERAAKGAGRNALAVTLARRSGVPITVAGQWNDPWPVDIRLTTFTSWHRDRLFPDGAAYELRDLAIRLSVPGNDPLAFTLRKGLPLEVKRVLERKRGGGGRVLDDAQIAPLLDHLALPPPPDTPPTTPVTAPLEALARELIVTRALAAAADLAAGKK